MTPMTHEAPAEGRKERAAIAEVGRQKNINKSLEDVNISVNTTGAGEAASSGDNHPPSASTTNKRTLVLNN